MSFEEGIASQELLAELHMRVSDQESLLAGLPSTDRILTLLTFTLDILAAEFAIWIPNSKQDPITTPPTTSGAARIRGWAMGHFITDQEGEPLSDDFEVKWLKIFTEVVAKGVKSDCILKPVQVVTDLM